MLRSILIETCHVAEAACGIEGQRDRFQLLIWHLLQIRLSGPQNSATGPILTDLPGMPVKLWSSQAQDGTQEQGLGMHIGP
jgi:hypothetical protein